jgi:hypothetical protein
MIAVGQNVKRLVAFGGRSAKTIAQAATLRRLEAGRSESHEVQGTPLAMSPESSETSFNRLAPPRARVNKGSQA